MTHTYPMYLAGYWKENGHTLDVQNPYDGSVAGKTFLAQPKDLDTAVRSAEEVFPKLRAMPVYERVTILKDLSAKLQEHRDTVIEIIATEAGKPVKEATVEFDRGVFTVDTAAEEAKRI